MEPKDDPTCVPDGPLVKMLRTLIKRTVNHYNTTAADTGLHLFRAFVLLTTLHLYAETPDHS